jgi:hypothetical protein
VSDGFRPLTICDECVLPCATYNDKLLRAAHKQMGDEGKRPDWIGKARAASFQLLLVPVSKAFRPEEVQASVLCALHFIAMVNEAQNGG